MQRRNDKVGRSNNNCRRNAIAVAVASCFAGSVAFANPTGGVVAHGQASISSQGNTLTVTNTPGTVINWQGFSIAGNEIARFIQQSQSSSVLNRVVGINPSVLLGSLQSNGRVFLVNPNGITIGPGANIDVAGFLASTLNLSDSDFLAGRMRFSETPGAGAVANQGTINTVTGGMVYLVGQDVRNSGIIRSPRGEIMLVAGKSVELVDAQTPEVRVQVTAPDNQAINLGQLIASGGRIGMYGTLVKHGGVANANTAVMGENGKVVFKAVKDVTLEAGSKTTANGLQGGSITVQAETGELLTSGTIAAKGEAGKGGTIRLLGNRVGLLDQAIVDVTGSAGGGVALIGGDYHGKNPDIPSAQRTYIGPNALIAADAIDNGDGGRVIVWSDEITRHYGTITARGGANGGNGGFAEVSGKGYLEFHGKTDLRAPHGATGTLLLDPIDITVANAGTDSAADVAIFADATCGAGDDQALCSISPATLDGAGANVILQAQNDITITDAINLTTTTDANLTMQAGRSILVNAGVATNGAGRITLVANNTDNNETDAAGGALTGSGGTNRSLGAGNLTVNDVISSGTGAIKLVSSGSVTSGGEPGSVALGANVTTGGDVTLIAGGGSISQSGGTVTAGTLTGSAGGTVNIGTAAVTNLGGFTSTGGFTLSDAGGLTVTGAVSDSTSLSSITTSSGDLSVTTGSVSGNGVSLTTTTSGNIALGGNVNAGAGTATLSAAGNISQSGGTVTAGTLTGSAGGTVNIGTAAVTNLGGFTSTGGFTLSDAGGLTVTGAVSDTGGTVSIATTGSALSIGAGINAVGQNLTLTGAGVTQTAGTILSATTTVNAGAGAIALNSATNNFTGTVTLNASGPNISIQDADALVLGVPALHGPNTGITAIAGTTLTLPAYSYSTGTGSIGFQSNGGTLATNGTLTTTTGNISLTGSSGISLAHNLTASGGDVSLLSPATLLTSIILTSGGGNISTESITGNTASGQNLGLVAGSGDITIAGDVGATRLGTLAVTSGDVVQFQGMGTQQVSTLNVTQSSSTAFAGALNVTNGVSLAATAGDVSFLNGLTTGVASSLATTGMFQLGDATADVSSIAGGLSRAAGLPSRLAGDITVTGAVSLSDTTVPAGQVATLNSGANPVTFTSTVDGPGGLIVNSGGVTTFTGQVGGTTALSGLATDAAGSTIINGGLVSTAGVAGQAYNDPVTVGAGPANTVFLSNGADVSFNQTLTGNGGDITFGSASALLGDLLVVGALTNVDDFDVFAGSASVNSGSNNSINRVAFNTSGNVSHFDQGGILLDASTVGGNLILTANTGSITQTGVVDVTGTATVTSNQGGITLGGAGIGFTAASAVIAANDGLGNDTGTLAIGAGGITATSAGGTIVLKAADGITVNGPVLTNNGDITIASGNAPGMTSLGIALANNPGGAALGSVAINAPVRAGSGDITIYSSGPVSQLTGAGNDAGLQTLNALTVRTYNNVSGAATITLDNDNNTANSTTPVFPSGCTGIAAGHGAGNCAFQITLETRQAGDTGVASTTAFPGGFAASQISYKSISGTQIIGIGTASDVLLEADSWTLGAGAINGRNVNIVATGISGGGTIDVGIAIPTSFINNNQTGGSLNLIAARDVNMLPGGSIGTAGTRFDHNLVLAAGNDINLQGSIFLAGDLNLRANALATDLFGNAPLGASGVVTMMTPGASPLEVRAANITLGTAARPVNGFTITSGTAATGEQADARLVADSRLDINLAGDFTATAGSALATAPTTAKTSADVLVRGGVASVIIGGNANLTGGTASVAGTAGPSQSASASAMLEGTAFDLSVAGDVNLAGGTSNAATGGNTATANAQILAHSVFSPVIQGDLNILGGTATAQPIPGQFANAIAAARLESDGDLQLKVTGNVDLQAGAATADNTGGGAFAEADAGALVRSGARVDIQVDQDFNMTGGTATATGSNLRAIASAGVFTGNLPSGETLLVKTLGNMALTGGTATGAGADAAALVYSSGEAKLTVGGPDGLRLEGGSGPFFPPFDSGVFNPNSDMFHLIGDTSLVRILGNAYPITVTGNITVVPNAALGAALFITEAPPLNLDALLAAFIKSTDCVSFSGGSCTLSDAAAANASGKTVKGAAGGVCK
ncbi:MAG: filamentous hemagglutinin N-terminal domain-containing protein [Burkholderiales bacterium]